MLPKTSKVSVIMPAFNESLRIESNIIETATTLEGFGFDFEIIVVDDGSSDGTHLHAAKVFSLHPGRVRVVRYDRNRGKGNAVMCGTRYASGDYVAFLDADMDLHPRQLPSLLEILEATGADVVIGSKRHPLSKLSYPLERRFYSMVYYAIIRLLFGLPVRDTQTGLKVFRIQVLHEVFPRVLVKRFAFDVETLALAHRLGYKIVEAPISLDFQRPFGRIKFNDMLSIFTDTLAIFYRMHILRYYDRGHGHFAAGSLDHESRELEAVTSRK